MFMFFRNILHAYYQSIVWILLWVLITAMAGRPAVKSFNENKTNTIKENLMPDNKQIALATFGGGCFWCMEAIFSRVKGVVSATSGYAGGHVAEPSYEQVKTGTTGHAEVVQVAFDPGIVSYHQLLEVFFRVHDPTTLNRQGADIGTQYRSVIFFHDDSQKHTADKVRDQLNNQKIYDNPVVTEISALKNFYKAEEYHQDYFAKNPDQAYCQMVILPKVKKFKSLFDDLLIKE